MLDVIRTVRPRWVVGENVYGIVNWSEGLVFERVCADLETAGYEVQPYIIPACGVGAPHRRDRCWFVAHRTDAGTETMRERSNGVHADSIASDPHASDASRGGQKVTGLPKTAMQSDEYRTGTGSRLNPLYVAEMMGFPGNWLVSPFLGGAGKPSKPAETP